MHPRDPEALGLVTHGTLAVEGRLLDASNVTLYCTVTLDGISASAVYKPVHGERPLWDFPHGTLAHREIASYLIANAAELGAIPPTALRDGPLGEGMVQLWVEATEEDLVDVFHPDEVPNGWRRVLHARDRGGEPIVVAHSDREDVRELAALDAVLNNADRKGGHVVRGSDDQVYGLDHGICLHAEPKLRTVLWGWAGEPLPTGIVERLRKLRADLDGRLGEQLGSHLTGRERRALDERVAGLLSRGTFPAPVEDFRAVPWPLF
ncbi:SCO1664 family protein [Haloechinothrix sp. LS1_15]|uniref:SCO1664 family protein n=1 Tax=Haloechinothrix sp. LS1_15 TaxID=2652248 RepID=UPI002944A3B7|nr:SCO1664 family protein [Haloechinothrix sp. LS1_15]MDV6014035.1 SCO1664 family protein [Haloechinothrix sp. LS1_15]